MGLWVGPEIVLEEKVRCAIAPGSSVMKMGSLKKDSGSCNTAAVELYG